jgi:hypothetical protein
MQAKVEAERDAAMAVVADLLAARRGSAVTETCDEEGAQSAVAIELRLRGIQPDSEAAEVNGDQRVDGATAQPAGAAAAPTGLPAGGQFGSGGSPAGLPLATLTQEPIPGVRYEQPPTLERTFPVLGPRWPDAPREVPWDFIEPHRRQALKNHDQTLERLAERGGLDPTEMVAVLEDRHYRNIRQIEAVDRLKELLAAWKAGRPAEESRP